MLNVHYDLQLANVLVGMGIGVDVPVAILMERCPELYMAMLAVLKVRLLETAGREKSCI